MKIKVIEYQTYQERSKESDSEFVVDVCELKFDTYDPSSLVSAKGSHYTCSIAFNYYKDGCPLLIPGRNCKDVEILL